jgi:hypothetical protein
MHQSIPTLVPTKDTVRCTKKIVVRGHCWRSMLALDDDNNEELTQASFFIAQVNDNNHTTNPTTHSKEQHFQP